MNIVSGAWYDKNREHFKHTVRASRINLQACQGSDLQVRYAIHTHVYINKQKQSIKFHVVDDLQTSVILGRDFLAETHTLTDVKRRKAYILKYKVEVSENGEERKMTSETIAEMMKVTVGDTDSGTTLEDIRMPVMMGHKVMSIPGKRIEQDGIVFHISNPYKAEECTEWRPPPPPKDEKDEAILQKIKLRAATDWSEEHHYPESILTKEQAREVKAVFDMFPETKHKEGLVPQAKFPPFDIDIPDEYDVKLKSQLPYKLSSADHHSVQHHIKQGLQQGLYRHPEPGERIITSPTFIKKEPGKPHGRLCTAYGKLNDVTRSNGYPLAHVQQMRQGLRRKYTIILDLKTGYHAIGLTKRTQGLMSVATKDGVYVPTRLTFGSKNAPAHFISCVNHALKDVDDTEAYMDDLQIGEDDFEQFLLALYRTLQQLKHYNLQYSPKKNQICSKVKYFLGWRYEWNEEKQQVEVTPDERKIQSITEFPKPRSKKALLRFLGMINYLQEGIPQLSEVIAPLSEALRKKSKVNIKSEAFATAFEKAKELLEDPVKRALFNPGDLTYLRADTSVTGTGAALFQIQNGREVPIAFFSKKLTPAQSRYSPASRELLGIHLASKHFREYLIPSCTVIFTDNTNVRKWLKDPSEICPRDANAVDYVMNLGCEIKYRAGKSASTQVPDALSRIHEPNLTDKEIEDIKRLIFRKQMIDKKKYRSTLRYTTSSARGRVTIVRARLQILGLGG